MGTQTPKDLNLSVPDQVSVKEGYTVLARRYRPQQFADLIGQEHVARALTNAIKTQRVSHAYLFTGARGVGKTSAARILAKALNCVHGPTVTPCDQCDVCRGITSGEDVDVLEIDGASNNKVDEVREIRQNVQYRPSRARYKIYIIDEVHMLSASAFNALLKTLEEPPAHVKFIFATTEVQKIPVTILSRCQRFDFAGIGSARIVERLRSIVAEEHMQADAEALELIARRAGGSMRDAQSLLDQLLAFGGDRLTVDTVHQLLGTAHDDRVFGLASVILEQDANRALALLAEAASEGLQLGEFLDQLMAYWRDLMVVKSAGAAARDLSIPDRYLEALAKQAESLALDTILAGLDVLATTKARLRFSSHARTLLEMAVVRLARLGDLVALSQLAELLRRPGAALPGLPKTAPRIQAPVAQPGPDALKKKLVSTYDTPATLKTVPLTPESVPQVWGAALKQLPHILASHFEKADLPAISGPNTLVIRFASGYHSDRDYCQRPGTPERLEEALRKVTGQPIAIRIESGSGDVPKAEEGAPAEPPPSPYRRQRAEAMSQPLVKRAMDLLGAQILSVDEGFGTVSVPPEDRTDTPDGEEA